MEWLDYSTWHFRVDQREGREVVIQTHGKRRRQPRTVSAARLLERWAALALPKAGAREVRRFLEDFGPMEPRTETVVGDVEALQFMARVTVALLAVAGPAARREAVDPSALAVLDSAADRYELPPRVQAERTLDLRAFPKSRWEIEGETVPGLTGGVIKGEPPDPHRYTDPRSYDIPLEIRAGEKPAISAWWYGAPEFTLPAVEGEVTTLICKILNAIWVPHLPPRLVSFEAGRFAIAPEIHCVTEALAATIIAQVTGGSDRMCRRCGTTFTHLGRGRPPKECPDCYDPEVSNRQSARRSMAKRAQHRKRPPHGRTSTSEPRRGPSSKGGVSARSGAAVKRPAVMEASAPSR